MVRKNDNLKSLFGRGGKPQTMNQTPQSTGVTPPTNQTAPSAPVNPTGGVEQPTATQPATPETQTPPATEPSTPPAVASNIPQQPTENQG